MNPVAEPTAAPAPREVLIATQTRDGFQVYSPSAPQAVFLVTGDTHRPHCSCPAFKALEHQPGYRCDHIKAVEAMLPDPPPPSAPSEADYPPSWDGEGNPTPAPVTMTLKRSVSPDRRIDSLSVEFTMPVSGDAPDAAVDQAAGLLQIQEDIAGAFLQGTSGSHAPQGNDTPRHGNGNGNGHAHPDPDGANAAHIESVGGMNTKYGWRMFLAVQVSGQQVKLFGNRQQLAQALEDAGAGDLAGNLRSGTPINRDCRAITRQDGRYLNIEKLLPRNGSGNGNGYGNGRAGR